VPLWFFYSGWYDEVMLRYWRIAFSAACGILCLLLIALWVRSYWYSDEFRFNITDNRMVWLHSMWGTASMFTMSFADPLLSEGPVIISDPIDRPMSTEGFSLSRRKNAWSVGAPLWCPALIFAALSIAPWLRWRFSLRTLLIVMTLLAILLGAIVISMR
jgi:hypothetical protein